MEFNGKKAQAYIENILALYENGSISALSVEDAIDFCRNCKIGSYKCSVKTMYGWCCDICLEEELLYLKSLGVATVNSCCGHGDALLASILTVGDESAEKMRDTGYFPADSVERRTAYGKPIHSWKPKSAFLYELAEDIPADVRPERHGRWQDTDMNGDFLYKCSECGDLFFPCDDGEIYFKFCPNCGAKMDGKDDNI